MSKVLNVLCRQDSSVNVFGSALLVLAAPTSFGLLETPAASQTVVSMVAQRGDPAPGLPGMTFHNFGLAYINNAGDVAFHANLGDGNGNFNGLRGVFVRRGATLSKVFSSAETVLGDVPLPSNPEPSLLNLDDEGRVLVQVPGIGGSHLVVDAGSGMLFQIVPPQVQNPNNPGVWTQMGATLMNGGLVVMLRYPLVLAGPTTGPIDTLWAPGRPTFGWPCPNQTLQAGNVNTLSNSGETVLTTGVACGDTGVVVRLNASTGFGVEVDRGCPYSNSICGSFAARSFSNALMSRTGHTVWTIHRADGEQEVVHNGVNLGTGTQIAGTYIAPGEELFNFWIDSIGDDGAIRCHYATRPLPGGSTSSSGAVLVKADGTRSLIFRSGEPISPGGPWPNTAFSCTAANVRGQVLTALTGPGGGSFTWDPDSGWRPCPKAGDIVQLNAGPLVALAGATIDFSHRFAGGPRALNDQGRLAMTITGVRPNQSPIDAVVIVDTLPSACNIADITEVGGTDEFPGNPDGQLTVDDLILFVNLFSAGTGCPGTAPCNRADVTGIGGLPEAPDGQLTVDDLIEFVNAFSAGC